MTILAFYPVDGQFERHSFDYVSHEEAFVKLWLARQEEDIHFYNTESNGSCDYHGLNQWIGNADDIETDYNDEILDGGWWMKYLNIRSDFAKSIIKMEHLTNQSNTKHYGTEKESNA